MKQIKAREVKPGMEVEFTTRMKVRMNILRIGPQQEMRDDSGHVARVDADALVTVLSEPAPPQPEEPTWFGARVVVDGRRFLRAPEARVRSWLEADEGTWWFWYDLINMGPVTVVPDQGWTVPDDTPEVPERVDEWDTWEDVPEGVTVANPELNYQYRKASGKIEVMIPISGGVWCETSSRLWTYPGPWTRETDA